MSNYVSYANATDLMTAIGNKFSTLAGAYVPRGSSAFANLPSTLSSAMVGYVYNVTDDFTTDNRFVEGTGKHYDAGANVVIVDVGSAGSPDLKFDVIGGFVDLSTINAAIAAIKAMIAGEFDATSGAYAAGDVVIYNNGLYKFTSAHTAGDPWDPTEVAGTTIDELIDDVLTTADTHIATAKAAVNANIAPDFDSTQAYAIDAVVMHDGELFKFTSAHTAGDPWSSSEVTATTVKDLISGAEPNPLTAAEITTLIGLL